MLLSVFLAWRKPSWRMRPFYPNHLPLETDNDLLDINNEITRGVG